MDVYILQLYKAGNSILGVLLPLLGSPFPSCWPYTHHNGDEHVGSHQASGEREEEKTGRSALSQLLFASTHCNGDENACSHLAV